MDEVSQPDLKEKSRKITLALRRPQIAGGRLIQGVIKEPFKFYAQELIGELPVFIFSSFQCEKFLRGTCTPCFYSGFPHSKGNKNEIYDSLLLQAEYIINNFDDLVLKRQKPSQKKRTRNILHATLHRRLHCQKHAWRKTKRMQNHRRTPKNKSIRPGLRLRLLPDSRL